MVSIQTIEALLPTPPDDFHYEVIQQSPQVVAVWLVHPDKYHYTDQTVRTIHSFVKNDRVYPPQNSTKMRKDSLCSVTELFTVPPFSAIIPKVTSLLHIK